MQNPLKDQRWTVRVLLEIQHPRADDKYTLVAYPQYTNSLMQHYPSNLQQSKEIVAGQEMSMSLFFPMIPSNNPSTCTDYHFWIFVINHGDDEDHLEVEKHLASGSIAVHDFLETDEIECVLHSIDQRSQGTLTLFHDQLRSNPILKRAISRSRSRSSKNESNVSNEWIQKARDVYEQKRVEFDDQSVFYSMGVHGGEDLPIIAFPILSTMIQYKVKEAEEFFVHLIAMTSEVHQIDIMHPDVHLDEVHMANFFGYMMNMIPRTLMYCNDSVRSSVLHSAEVDVWSRLLCHPHLELASFDCEDGSQLILELCYVLKHLTNYQSSILDLFVKFAQHYTFFGIQLKIKPGGNRYIGHYACIGLDQDFVDYLIGTPEVEFTPDEYYPGLFLESTGSVEACWGKEYWADIEVQKQLLETYELTLDVAGKCTEPYFERSKSILMPSFYAKEHAVYGKIAHMQTADHREGEGLHLVLKHPSPKTHGKYKIGIDLHHLLQFEIEHPVSKSVINVLGKLTKRELDHYKETELSMLPYTYLPLKPIHEDERYTTDMPHSDTEYKVVNLCMRNTEFQLHKERILHELVQDTKEYTVKGYEYTTQTVTRSGASFQHIRVFLMSKV